MRFRVSFTETSTDFPVTFSDEADFNIDFDEGMEPMPVKPYRGSYEVTPSREMQMLDTEGLLTTAPVVVHPIPPCYGLITYNGFEILVS